MPMPATPWTAWLLSAALAIALSAERGEARRKTPEAKCASIKFRATAKKAAARLHCYDTAQMRSVEPDPACLTRAENAFAAAFLRAEKKSGCLSTGDAAAIEQEVDAFVQEIGSRLRPDRFTTASTSSTTPTSSTVTTTVPSCSGASGAACGSCGTGQCCANDSACTHDGGPVCVDAAVGACAASTCTSDAQCRAGTACIETGAGIRCCELCP